jgi:hypothetical protein
LKCRISWFIVDLKSLMLSSYKLLPLSSLFNADFLTVKTPLPYQATALCALSPSLGQKSYNFLKVVACFYIPS